MAKVTLHLQICAGCRRDVAQVVPSKTQAGRFVAVCDPIRGGCGRLIGFYPTEAAAVDGWNDRNGQDFGPVSLEVVL